jgi:hypothetical protein
MHRFVAIILTLALLHTRPASVLAQSTSEPGPLAVATGLDMVGTSAYVWRGFVPTEGFSLEPNLWVRVGRVTLSSWMNVDGSRTAPAFTEHDFSIDYSHPVGRWTMSAGWINYLFPAVETGRHSDEVYAGVSHASYFNPVFRLYVDVHAGSGAYASLGASHVYDLPRGLAIQPSLTVGYNHEQWMDQSMLSDVNAGVKLTLPTLAGHWTLSPFVNYSRSLDADVLPSRVYGGLAVSVR